MTQRFDVNNKELNKKKFNEQVQHIVTKQRKVGAKFSKTTIEMSLTPTNLSEEDKKDEVEKQSDALQLDSSSDEPDELAAKKRLYPFGSESESVKRAKMDPTLL